MELASYRTRYLPEKVFTTPFSSLINIEYMIHCDQEENSFKDTKIIIKIFLKSILKNWFSQNYGSFLKLISVTVIKVFQLYLYRILKRFILKIFKMNEKISSYFLISNLQNASTVL